MRWGKTYEEGLYEEKKWRRKRRIWKEWFAWYPICLEKSGRWVWWEIVECKIDIRAGRLGSYRKYYRSI